MNTKQLKQKQIELKSLIAKNLVICGYSKKELAIKLCMSTSSLYSKINDPNKFTLKELRGLFEVLRFTQEDKLAVI